MTNTERADKALAEGIELVGLVRDYGREITEPWLRERSRLDLETLCVALAALVPDDRSPSELLAWLVRPATVRRASVDPRELRPCGTHAAFTRHKNRGEQPDDDCLDAERLYQRSRPSRRAGARAALLAEQAA